MRRETRGIVNGATLLSLLSSQRAPAILSPCVVGRVVPGGFVVLGLDSDLSGVIWTGDKSKVLYYPRYDADRIAERVGGVVLNRQQLTVV